MPAWEIFVSILILLVLAAIAWQDFKTREVSVLLLLAFTVLQLIKSFIDLPWKDVAYNISFSACFLLLQFGFISLYFYLKGKVRKTTYSFSELIGGADIWMLLALLPGFAWPLYILFITASTLITLVLFLMLKSIGKFKDERIPLAGFYAVFYLIVFVCSIIWKPELLLMLPY